MKVIIFKRGEMVFMGSLVEFFNWMLTNSPDADRIYVTYDESTNSYTISNEYDFLSDMIAAFATMPEGRNN